MRYLTRAVWMLLVPVLVALAAPFVWQVTTGDSFMVVDGVSMEPTYQVGDVLVVQEPTGHDLDVVGQPVVVTFVPGDLSSQYVHRVHEITDEGVILKGDGNDIADPVVVTQEQVVGTPRTVLAGDVATLYQLTQSWGARGLVALVVLTLAVIPTHRRRDEQAAAPDAPQPTGRRARSAAGATP